MKPHLIVIGPLPPPTHGVAVSTALVLENAALARVFAVEHIDTSDPRPLRTLGSWDLNNIRGALASVARLARRLRGPSGVVYLPLSQGAAGLTRDSLFVLVAAARGWKVCAHLRGAEFDTVYAGLPLPLRWLVRSALSRVSSVAVMGHSLRGLFDGLVPPDHIAVVPNGTPDISSNGVRRNRETGLFFSNLRRRKGVVEAVETALLVLRDHPSARFLFVGEWEGPELEQTLRKRARHVGDRIRFDPPVTGEARDHLLASSGFLIFPPVLQEGHPRVVLEALAAGLPVITTARGAIPETVVDGECGYVLDDPLPEALAERILTLLERPDLHARMSLAARTRYLDGLTQEQSDAVLATWLHGVASGL